MAILDIFKRRIAAAGDQADIQTALSDLSSTTHAPVPVATATEAAQIAADAPDEAFPLYTATGAQLFVQPARDEPRRQIAGDMAQLSSYVSAVSLTAGAGKYLTHRAFQEGTTPGWGITTTGTGLIVPEDGLYLFQGELKATPSSDPSATTSNTGQSTLRFYAADHWFAQEFTDAGRFHILAMWRMTEGQTISLFFQHGGPNAVSVYGSIMAEQIAA